MIDGDTIVVDIHFAWSVALINEHVRCLGYDAWEVSRRRGSVDVTDEEIVRGLAATEAFRRLLDSADAIYLIPGDQPRDSFGRILAHVWIVPQEGRPFAVADWMRHHGHTRREAE